MNFITEGMKSSEFFVTLLALVLIALAPQLGMTPEQVWQLVGASGLYSASRGLAKKHAETK